MQVESLAALVLVVWFLPNTAGFGFGFSLPPFLPPSHSLSFASLWLHLHVLALSPLCTPGRAGPGAPTARGGALPQPVKGFREESEHGEHVVLAAKDTESGARGVGSWQHQLWRQSSVRAELTLCPLPPLQANQILIIWSVLDAKIKRKNEL